MVNRVTLVGRLGQEPETNYTPSGKTLCRFSLATSEKYKDHSGQPQERTEWHNIRAWGKLGEICQQYLHKGGLVYIEGQLRYEKWEKDGQKRSTTTIVAREMRMLGSKPSGGSGSAYGSDAAEARGAAAPEAPPSDITDEDVPF
jgi:single-strand DNA-binding protein